MVIKIKRLNHGSHGELILKKHFNPKSIAEWFERGKERDEGELGKLKKTIYEWNVLKRAHFVIKLITDLKTQNLNLKTHRFRIQVAIKNQTFRTLEHLVSISARIWGSLLWH